MYESILASKIVGFGQRMSEIGAFSLPGRGPTRSPMLHPGPQGPVQILIFMLINDIYDDKQSGGPQGPLLDPPLRVFLGVGLDFPLLLYASTL